MDTTCRSYSNDGLEYNYQPYIPHGVGQRDLQNGDYVLVISQAGSGYSWRTHAGLNRINRWEQNLIRDR